MVLFNVKRVHYGEDADVIRLSGEEYLALRNDDRTLNLEFTECSDLLTTEYLILEFETCYIEVPVVEVASVRRVNEDAASFKLVDFDL